MKSTIVLLLSFIFLNSYSQSLLSDNFDQEYDFSKGKRGLYSRDLNDLHLPVYLDPNLEKFYKNILNVKSETSFKNT